MTNREEKKEMPDFNELTDRIIQETPKGPFIGVKTNLDPEDPEKFNPYRPGEEARS
ncbi:hypothetical protein [Ammoniphilus sp. CFH 90114]|uniref:hypothetical protein n=1 Tax=Ammoniphilus sp. CFH 90114 TaxID=2493665 RepID=UPI0013E947B8|nr:hypothetical protein [Ammoniphilus sp. CFH 90114]